MIPKIHPRFPNYEIRPDGRVFRIRLVRTGKGNPGRLGEVKGRVLKASGYRQFKLIDHNGEMAFIRANRLIAETFHGAAPSPKHHAAHNDGVRLNNAFDNVRWATPKENCKDLELHGTKCKGSRMPNAAWSDAEVVQIRASFTGNHGDLQRLANKHGVGASTMGRLVYGETYIDAAVGSAPRRSKRLTPAQRTEIFETYISKGFAAAKAIADAYGLNKRRIAAIARERGYGENHRRGRGIIDRKQTAGDSV